MSMETLRAAEAELAALPKVKTAESLVVAPFFKAPALSVEALLVIAASKGLDVSDLFVRQIGDKDPEQPGS